MTAAQGAALRSAPAFPGSLPAARSAASIQSRIHQAPDGPVLVLDDIGLAFGGVAALSGVSLSVEAGEIRAIIGPNGAGKSSLINVISGIYRPDRGSVRLGDRSFRQVPTSRLAHLGIARTFQNLALFHGLSVRDNVVAAAAAGSRAGWAEQVIGVGRARREREEAWDRADGVLGFLHLAHIAERLIGTLPYGLQKRVELARALVVKPKLLLLDEPMAGVSATEKGEMAGFVRAARDAFGTTVILIEHDVGVVMDLSDKVAVLDYGRKIADDTPEAIQGNQAVIDAYLGVAHDDEAA